MHSIVSICNVDAVYDLVWSILTTMSCHSFSCFYIQNYVKRWSDHFMCYLAFILKCFIRAAIIILMVTHLLWMNRFVHSIVCLGFHRVMLACVWGFRLLVWLIKKVIPNGKSYILPMHNGQNHKKKHSIPRSHNSWRYQKWHKAMKPHQPKWDRMNWGAILYWHWWNRKC